MADLNQTVKYIVELDGKISPSIKKLEKVLKNIQGEIEGVNKTKVSPEVDPKSIKGFKNLKSAMGGIMDKVSGSIPLLGELGPALTNPYVAAGVAIGAAAVHLGTLSSEIRKVQKQVKVFNDNEQDVRLLTNGFRALQKTFKDIDINDLNKASNSLQKNFNVNAREALDIINDVSAATNGMFDLDQLTEYSVQFKQLGYNAREFANISAAAFKSGVYQDKLPDALKEAGIRLNTLTKGQRESLKKTGLDVSKLEKDLASGAIKSSDAIAMIADKTKDLSKTDQKAVLSDIFGGAGEDAGLKAILEIEKIQKNIIDGAAKNNKILQANNKLTEAQDKATRPLVDAIGSMEEIWIKIQTIFYKAVTPIVKFFSELFKTIWELKEIFALVLAPLIISWGIMYAKVRAVIFVVTKLLTAIRALVVLVKMSLSKAFDYLKQKVVDIFGEERIKKWKENLTAAIRYVKGIWTTFANSVSEIFEKLQNFADRKGWKTNSELGVSSASTETPGSEEGKGKNTKSGGVDLGAANQGLMDNTVGSTTQAEVKTINVTIDKLQEIGVQNITGDEDQFKAQLQAALQAIIEDTSQL